MASRALPAGVSCTLELGMRFARWASRLSALPEPEPVMREFAVSRATAFRYIEAFRNFASIDGVDLMDRRRRKPLRRASGQRSASIQFDEGSRPGPLPLSPGTQDRIVGVGMSYVLIPMKTPDPDPKHPERPVTRGVRDRVGMHPATIYAEIKADRFPKPVKLGRSSRWVESEIDDYIAARMRERDQESARSSPEKL